MKALIAVLLFALTVSSQAASNSQAPSGLQITELNFTKKFIKKRGFSGSMVSHDPPVLDNSTIMIPGGGSRNPAIRNKTEKATIASSARRIGGQPHTSVVWDWRGWVYDFEANVKNSTTKTVSRFVWAYTVPTEPGLWENVEQEYICRVWIKPGETQRIKVRSPIPRPKTIDVSDASKWPKEHEPTLTDMAINQIEFDDGTVWRRENWNPVVLTRLGAMKLAKGKCLPL